LWGPSSIHWEDQECPTERNQSVVGFTPVAILTGGRPVGRDAGKENRSQEGEGSMGLLHAEDIKRRTGGSMCMVCWNMLWRRREGEESLQKETRMWVG